MLSRRLFEGPDIQKVLARIQAELGPSAQIISAEKVRRGGVGGFFARETYQVVVDGPEEPVSRPTLLSSRRRAAGIAPAPAAPGAGERTVPVPSTEGAPFAEVLRRLTENTQPTGGAPTAAVAATPAPHPAQVDAVVDEDLTSMLRQMSAARAVAEAAEGQMSTEAWIEDARTEGVLPTEPAEDDTPIGEMHGAEIPADDLPVAEMQIGDMPVDDMPIDDMEGDEMQVEDMGIETAEAEGAEAGHMHPALTPTEPLRAEGATLSEDRRPVLADLQAVPLPPADPKAGLNGITPARARPALKRMGLPASLLPADGRLGLVPALYRALSRMPMAPPVCLQPGEVMAVIGAADRALVLASRLALSIGLDPAEVVVASPAEVGETGSERMIIGSGAAAESHAEQWAARSRPTVVSIAAAPGSGRETWASNVIEALQPAAVWGVVEATRKPEDVSAWSDAVGQVDALALEDVDATTSPAAVLGTGIPVALLDGQLASPEAWTALLAGRLRAAA
ncbi:MAG TPA: hypothetical protein VFH50_06850 [Acidimicrobiales bacterium]|nr:hypothetical protein [Acidimicrobiales bacterium]